MSNPKILLVDDEPSVREVTAELLMNGQYDVQTAPNGQAALDLLEYWVPDLILCDLTMPVMDGYQLHAIVKDCPMLSPIPFIFLTAKKENNLMRKCLTNGADDFVSKPFKIKELLTIISKKIARFEKTKHAHHIIPVGTSNNFQHEINTPLFGILGSVALLKGKLDYTEDEMELLYDAIAASGERLKRTLKNIMFYQNLVNNLVVFRTDSSSAIESVLLDVKEKIFDLHSDQEDRVHFVIDDAQLQLSTINLYFIVYELLDNALKFSLNTSAIIVSGNPYNDSYYELIIKDFGIGFSETEIQQIGAGRQFNREVFEQQGIGLGLFMSKTIVKKVGGIFSLVSKEGTGTTIHLFLPLKKVQL